MRTSEQIKEYKKEWAMKNKLRLRAERKEWEMKNKDEISLYQKEYREKNKISLAQQKKDYYESKKEIFKSKNRKYSKNNRETINAYKREYDRERRATDIQFRLAVNLRARLRMALKKNTKAGSAIKDLGCTISELKFYLEGKFTDGMTWKNYGKWHIDHEIPLTFYNLTIREHVKKACHYTNLQPMWAVENIIKSNKII